MDLGFVTHTRGTQAEHFGGPVQVVLPLCLPQWEAFTEGGFVDLHDLDAGGFQVHHFVTNRQGQLTRLHFAAHVFARE
ncbi:hypothetical protein PS663_05718 [Pseudomonas fluorescens]|nr:hypothetical protein PS663_05718 [Pseudomonas fluorescens]